MVLIIFIRFSILEGGGGNALAINREMLLVGCSDIYVTQTSSRNHRVYIEVLFDIKQIPVSPTTRVWSSKIIWHLPWSYPSCCVLVARNVFVPIKLWSFPRLHQEAHKSWKIIKITVVLSYVWVKKPAAGWCLKLSVSIILTHLFRSCRVMCLLPHSEVKPTKDKLWCTKGTGSCHCALWTENSKELLKISSEKT